MKCDEVGREHNTNGKARHIWDVGTKIYILEKIFNVDIFNRSTIGIYRFL